MLIKYDNKIIDTNNPPFGNDRKLLKCCRHCDAYCGNQHDFDECSNCPVLSLYKEWVVTEYQNWVEGWKDGTYQNGA